MDTFDTTKENKKLEDLKRALETDAQPTNTHTSSKTPNPKMPAPSSALLSHETPVHKGGVGYKTPKAAEALEAAQQKLTPAPKPVPPPNTERARTNILLSPMRTYKDDLASFVQRKKISGAIIAQTEAESQARLAPTSSKTILWIRRETMFAAGLSMFLLAVGGSSLYAVYLLTRARATPIDAVPINPIVKAESYQEVSLAEKNKETLVRELSSIQSGQNLTPGSLVYIYFTETTLLPDSEGVVRPGKQLAPINKFFSAVAIRPPDMLMRALDAKFTVGVHIHDAKYPFLLMKVRSFGNAFAGMFQWEKQMPADLQQLFGLTSLPQENAPQFEDQLAHNKDVRVLTMTDGLLPYTFVDQNTLLIATHKETVREIINRLISFRGK